MPRARQQTRTEPLDEQDARIRADHLRIRRVLVLNQDVSVRNVQDELARIDDRLEKLDEMIERAEEAKSSG